MGYRKRKLLKSGFSIFLSVLLLFTSIPLQGFADDLSFNDNFMDPTSIMDMLPDQQQMAPQVPNPVDQLTPSIPKPLQGQQSPQGPVNQPQADSSPNAAESKPADVNLATGNLSFDKTDLDIPGIGSGFTLKRTYSSDKDTVGAFGRGWDFNFNSRLQIFSGYDMAETRADGNVLDYQFVMDDPDGYVTVYDDDNLINYELDKGHYQNATNGDTLRRISKSEYVAQTSLGTTITYNGYFAPWRGNSDSPAGKMTKSTDRYGNTMQYGYDSQGHLDYVIDTAGRTIDFVWNGNVISEVKYPTGNSIHYDYDSNQCLEKVTYRDGRSISYQYSGSKVVAEVNGNNEKTQYHYDNGRVSEVLQPDGTKAFALNYQINGAGAVTKTTVTNASNEQWQYVIENNQISAETNPLGQVTTYKYNSDGFLTEQKSANGTLSFTYDNENKKLSQTQPDGTMTTYRYNPKWDVPDLIQDNRGHVSSYVIDETSGNVTQKIENGITSTYQYTNRGEIKSVLDVNGQPMTFTYKADGTMSEVVNGEGEKTAYSFDALGRLVTEQLPSGVTTHYTYDNEGRLLTKKVGDNIPTEYQYDNAGRLYKVVDPLKNVVQYNYDANGRLKEYKDALNRTFSYEYFGAGRIKSITNPMSEKQSFTYDVLGRIKTMTSTVGTTTYTYGIYGVTTITNPFGTYTIHYNAKGLMDSVTDQMNRITTYEYDSNGMLKTVKDPLGRMSNMDYYSNGQPKSQTLPDGQTIQFTYNAVGLL
ncbi:MAG: hypothetical protein K0Q73_8140, partial [Paenibacillus sp.]|nr:hypothetical protein [Paenibacillus sp.]